MPDRCLVHGCSNRSDMNAGISAHFSPTITREWDTWLRFVHTHRTNLNPSGKFVAGVFKSISRRNVFKSVSHGRLLSSAYSWLNSYNTEDRARETIFQTTTTLQGKPCSILSAILSKLQLCQPWSFLFRRSILYVYSQISLRFVNIFSSNSLSLVLFISPRCCILVFYPFCLTQSCGALGRWWFTEELFNGFQSFQINHK